ncbi:MAG: hypothetical protein ACO3EZ_04820 [Prochlorotrichaceae cyanobacterium]
MMPRFPEKVSAPKLVAFRLASPGWKLPISLLCCCLAVGISGCANTALGQRIEQALSIPSPLPRTEETPIPTVKPSPTIETPTITPEPRRSPTSSPDNNTEEPQSPSPLPTVSPTISGTEGATLELPIAITPTIESVLALNLINVPTTPASVWEQSVTRRQFARWLFELNNRLYADRPGEQIRASSTNATPTFQDIPRTDPDFVLIQGLAEAGILPSPLRGNTTATQFRPDAPLTREAMVLWKVPLDARQSLPAATIDRIEQTWNFQDSQQISGEALGAVLLDFQNGELSNIRRVFGYTTLLQPQKAVTQAEAIVALSYFGFQGQGVSAANPPANPTNETSQ